MAINDVALKAEIESDPQTYGFAVHVAAGEPELIAEKLNKIRDGTDGETAITVRRADIEAWELLEVIDARDFITNATNLQTAWFESATQAERIRLIDDTGVDTRMLGNFERSLVAVGQGSKTRVRALANRFGSRAEQLFGAGTFIGPDDVGQALRS